MFKKIASLLMVFALTLSATACGSKNNNDSKQNASSYNETEIGGNSKIQWLGGGRFNSKNQLVVVDRGDGTNSGFSILDLDGKPVGNINCSLPGIAWIYTLDPQDNIYVLMADIKEDSITQKLKVVSPAGVTLKDIDLSVLKGSETSSGQNMQEMDFAEIALDIAVDSAGSIYLASTSKGIQVLDKSGQLVKTLGVQGCQSVDIDSDGNVIVISYGKSKSAIEKLDAAAGKSIWSADLAVKNGMVSAGSNKVRYSGADKCIYYMDQEGVTKYNSSGKLIGTALDFKSYSLLTSGYNISDMCIDTSSSIFITTSSSPESAEIPVRDIGYKIYRYSIQSGNSAVQDQKTITVSIPSSNRTLDMAVSKFQKKNPGYKVNVQTYPNQDATGSDYDTYAKNLNTQILSGKGPDIMLVSGLPFNNYVSKNILANLSDMIGKDKSFDMSKYYSNIFDALKYNGSLYMLPTNFLFNVVMANQEVLDQEAIIIDDSKWTWNDFKSIAEKLTGSEGSENLAALPSLTSSDLLNLFTGGSYSNYFDIAKKSAGFTSKGFIDLLNTVKDFGNLADSSIKNDEISILQAASRGTLAFYPYTIADYNMYGFLKSAYKSKLSLYNMPSADGNREGTFMSGSLYAINKNSKYALQCWELLKTLISDDVQSAETGGTVKAPEKSQGVAAMIGMGGFSVNKAAQQKKAQQAIKMTRHKMTWGTPEGEITLDAPKMTQANIDYINKFISGLKNYASYDANISNIVQDETKAYFSGEKSADETVRLIQDRANTYLGE